jgi:hypothetical protein
VFHSYTGCDTTSAFKGKGKKSALEAWKQYDKVTTTFIYLAPHLFTLIDIDSENFQKLERLVVVL